MNSPSKPLPSSSSKEFYATTGVVNLGKNEVPLMKEAINDPRIQEWMTLHHDFEKYEQFALIIKLVCVIISVVCLTVFIDTLFSIILILTLWLQEGIWKTYQARIGARILVIEQQMLKATNDEPHRFQFYSEWEKNRPGMFGLMMEYIKNSFRPTVIYPYKILIVITIISAFI